ncbi:MAG TPA: ABC transporter substrate-binding protein [Chloroflexota bacterium]
MTAISRRAFLLAGAGTMVLAACGGAQTAATPAASKAPQKLRLVSWSTPRAEQANLFVAQDLGYYAQQGIDFEYRPGSGSGEALKQILAGNGDVAFVGPEAMYFTADQGGDAVGIYNIYPQSLFVLLSWPDSGIRKPADLKGKTIGVLSLASGSRYNVMSILALNGLKESDVTLVATGPAPGALLEHKVDAWSSLTTTAAELERQTGRSFDKMLARDYLNLPTDVLATTRDIYTKQPDLLVRFLRALRQGTQYTIDHPAEAASIAVKTAQDIKDPAQAETVIRAFGEASQSPQGLGGFDMSILQRGADAYQQAGLITTKVDVSRYFSNDLVAKL